MTRQFDKQEQIRFWSANTEAFKGGVVSDVVLDLFDRFIGEKAVDVGAGAGDLKRAFKVRYAGRKHIVAIDLVPKCETVKQGDCTALPFSDGEFDTYFATDVIEHLSDADLKTCLKEANRVLCMGGYGLFTTPYNEDLSASTTVCPDCGARFHRWGHCQTFHEATLGALLEYHGFAVKKMIKVNLALLVRYGVFARLFYALRLPRLVQLRLLETDFLVAVKKVRNA